MKRTTSRTRLLILAGLTCGAAALATDLSTVRTTYIVGDAHLDTQWQWDFAESYTQLIPTTFRCNMALFAKYPKYVFSFEGSWRWMCFKRFAPNEWAQVKDYVAKGNFAPAGGMVDAADVNIPCIESLMHQVLYGNGFYMDEFGKKSHDIFLPDCFGFTYALPTIAAHCGLIGFSTQKFDLWGGWFPSPFGIGLWEGVDGSTIYAALKPGNYSDNQWDIRQGDGDALFQKAGIWATYDYFGVGDRGGCVADNQVSGLMARINANASNTVKVVSAGSSQMFLDLDSLPDATKAKLSRYKGELIMTTHGTGCYTAHADVKIRNRKNEVLALNAERASVAGEWVGGAAYPRDKIKDSWIRFMWHQFHDDLTGTSIPDAYTKFTIPALDSTAAEFTAMMNTAHQAVAARLNTIAGETGRIPVVVFNPLSIERTDYVEASVAFSAAPAAVQVFGPSGQEVPAQIVKVSGSTATVGFIAKVPSVGYAVYEVKPAAAPSTLATGLSADVNTIENAYYRVSIDAAGDISQVYDKKLQKNLLASPSRWEIRRNNSSTWPAWEVLWSDVSSMPRSYVDEAVTKRVLENGPARVCVEVKRTKETSSYTHRIRLCADSVGSYVEVDNDVDWKTPSGLLKASFPTAASNANATFDLGIGVIQRPNMNASRYEVPAQDWADLTNTDNSFGVTVLTDYKRGWDKANNSTLHLTLVHSPTGTNGGYYGDHFMHNFRYGIFGHSGSWKNGSVWAGQRFNHQMVAFQTTAHDGVFGKVFSTMSINSDKVALLALKKAEKSDQYVVRVRELEGSAQTGVAVAFSGPVTAVSEMSGAEEAKPACSAIAGGNGITFDIGGFAPKTYAVTLGTAIPQVGARRSGVSPLPVYAALTVLLPGSSGRSITLKTGKGDVIRSVRITDGLGKTVATLLDNTRMAPVRTVSWNGTDGAGRTVKDGVYFITAGGATSRYTAKINLIR